MNRKKCIKCEIDKELRFFNKNKSKSDGVNSICKMCHSEYRKDYYIKNKEKELNQVKKYQSKITNILKKRGQTIPSNCPACEKITFLTKKENANNYKRYCSNKCRSTTNKTNYEKLLTQIKKRASKKSIDFNLNSEFIKNLLEVKQNNKCALSGIPIVDDFFSKDKKLHSSASLDRIDNKGGYTKDNVQWVSLGVNYMKLDWTNDEAKILLKLISENYKQI